MSQKTLLLTGASRGIGHATVKRFSSEGWRVLTCSRKPFDERCPWPGGEENHIQVDLSDPNSTINAIPIIKEKVNGRLDILVNNAGISQRTQIMRDETVSKLTLGCGDRCFMLIFLPLLYWRVLLRTNLLQQKAPL